MVWKGSFSKARLRPGQEVDLSGGINRETLNNAQPFEALVRVWLAHDPGVGSLGELQKNVRGRWRCVFMIMCRAASIMAVNFERTIIHFNGEKDRRIKT